MCAVKLDSGQFCVPPPDCLCHLSNSGQPKNSNISGVCVRVCTCVCVCVLLLKHECVHMQECMFHNTHEEIMGQLLGISFLLTPCAPGCKLRLSGLCGKHFDRLSYLCSPIVFLETESHVAQTVLELTL